MDPIIGAALISGGSSLLGGLMGSKGAGKGFQADLARELQQDVMNHTITRRVKDAKRAGIHPLYALGASSVSPSAVSLTPQMNPVGNAISDMGQDLGRAFAARGSHKSRAQDKLLALQLERGELENQLLRSNIAKVNSSLPPPLPSATDSHLISGQGNSVQVQPLRPTASQLGIPSQEVGAVSDYGYVRTGPRSYAIVPSQDAKSRIEDQLIPEVSWAVRNHLLPALGGRPKPPPSSYLPPGYSHWRFNPFTGEYVATGKSGLYGEIFK